MAGGMNDYDKAGRYLLKRDPAGMFRWLLGGPAPFHAWIDARRLALRDQGDLTGDLVAAFRVGAEFEALCVELQAESRPETAGRLLLGYVPRLAAEPTVPPGLPLAAVGGVVINLTGPAQPAALRLSPTVAPACRLEGAVLQRTLRDEDAAGLLSDVTTGAASAWLLAWLPLMRGGNDSGIIDGWKREAERLSDERERSDLAWLTLPFADLSGRVAEWRRGLRGWNVLISPTWEAMRQDVRAEECRDAILVIGRQRFGRAPSRKQRVDLDAIADPERLERMRDRLLTAASWADLLATP